MIILVIIAAQSIQNNHHNQRTSNTIDTIKKTAANTNNIERFFSSSSKTFNVSCVHQVIKRGKKMLHNEKDFFFIARSFQFVFLAFPSISFTMPVSFSTNAFVMHGNCA